MSDDPMLGASDKTLRSETVPAPTDEDVVRALVEIEKTSTNRPSAVADKPLEAPSPFVKVRDLPAGDRLRLAFVVSVFVLGTMSASWKLALANMQRRADTRATTQSVNVATQAQAEQMLRRLADGDSAAADQVIAQAPTWLGSTHRTPTADAQLMRVINSHQMHAREAALEAELALDNVPKNAVGLDRATQAADTPGHRQWGLWMLGALGNRGVDPVHVAKIIGSYLDSPDIGTRAGAVNGLALLATDETIPMMLDRFRNDPSPVVQERAACALAESGMYNHSQRMQAAHALINWLDDPLISAQQRTWIAQALTDISGRNLGADSAAWREWYSASIDAGAQS